MTDLLHETNPRYEPGSRITCRATAAIIGGHAVQISGAREEGLITVKPGDAAEKCFGVAVQDAADGDNVTVVGSGFVVPCAVTDDLLGGDEVEVAATGTFVAKASGIAVGVACDTIDGDPVAAIGDIKLY